MTSQTETRTVYRQRIPVDDEWHTVRIAEGSELHAAARTEDSVDLWYLHDPAQPGAGVHRRFRIFGTAQPLPADATHVRSAVTPDGAIVWHLFEATP